MQACSVIICAHNEERSIGGLLADVMSQHIPGGWTLREVLVVADGCRDATEHIVRDIASREPGLRLLSLPYPNRGKSRAFNEGIVTLTDDAVVMFDADVKIAHEGVMAELLGAIEDGAVLVSGHDVPDPMPVRTWGHAASLGRHLIKQALKASVPSRDNVYSCVGRCMAMHRRFYDGLLIPDVPGEDNFRFFTAVQRGLPYAYVHDAVVFFTPARTVADYIRQHARFWHGVAAFRSQFRDTADYGRVGVQFRAVLTSALHHPFIMSAWATAACMGQLVYLWQRYVSRVPQTGLWETATSTK